MRKDTTKEHETPVDAENPRRDTIRKLLRSVEEKLSADTGKVSLADYIRLLQLEREMEAEEPPREIRVTWVDQRERTEPDE